MRAYYRAHKIRNTESTSLEKLTKTFERERERDHLKFCPQDFLGSPWELIQGEILQTPLNFAKRLIYNWNIWKQNRKALFPLAQTLPFGPLEGAQEDGEEEKHGRMCEQGTQFPPRCFSVHLQRKGSQGRPWWSRGQDSVSTAGGTDLVPGPGRKIPNAWRRGWKNLFLIKKKEELLQTWRSQTWRPSLLMSCSLSCLELRGWGEQSQKFQQAMSFH